MYFELPAVHSLLHGVSRLSSPGSTLVVRGAGVRESSR